MIPPPTHLGLSYTRSLRKAASAQNAAVGVGLPSTHAETVYVHKCITQPIDTIRFGRQHDRYCGTIGVLGNHSARCLDWLAVVFQVFDLIGHNRVGPDVIRSEVDFAALLSCQRERVPQVSAGYYFHLG